MDGHIAVIQLLGANGLTCTSRISESAEELEKFVTELVGEPTSKKGEPNDPKYRVYWEMFHRIGRGTRSGETIDISKVYYSKDGVSLGGDTRGDHPDIQVVWVPLNTTFCGYCD